MPTGSRMLKSSTLICVGDMNTKVKLYERNQKAPLDKKYRLNLELISTPWTKWEVKNGVQIFDGTNIVGTATDIFTMYYNEKVVKKVACGTIFIEYDESLYKVLQVKPTDKKNKIFMQLLCTEQGKSENKTGVNIL